MRVDESFEEDGFTKWSAAIALGIVWLAVDLVMQSMTLLDEPLRVQRAIFSTVIVVCFALGVSDLWRRYVASNYLGMALATIFAFGVKIWLFNKG